MHMKKPLTLTEPYIAKIEIKEHQSAELFQYTYIYAIYKTNSNMLDERYCLMCTVDVFDHFSGNNVQGEARFFAASSEEKAANLAHSEGAREMLVKLLKKQDKKEGKPTTND